MCVPGGERRLVGRDIELKLIEDLVDGLDADPACVTLQLAGEPGIGKTELLRELSLRARTRSHLVLEGRAAEFEAELPFGVFGDALDDWLTGRTPADLQVLAGSLASELALVLPAFEALAGAHPTPSQEERYRSYRAVRALLARAAAEAPLVLILDDVQWADPGSVELICHLLAHPPRGPVLLVVSFRPTQISQQLRAALAAALRNQRARRLDLRLLTRAEARELLGPAVSPATHDRLCRESGGNPFFLLQLARSEARTDEDPATGPQAATSVPAAVRATLTSELASLSATARLVLEGAAVAGDPFDELAAASASGLDEADAHEVIDELVDSELVRSTEGIAGRYAFRHPIVRATIYEAAGAGWRARAHARLASSLAARGASAPARAPHVERSARAGDDAAVALLAEAGAASARRTPALAARWYAAALETLVEHPSSESRRIELLVALATALGGSGQLARARAALCEVLDRVPPSDPRRIDVVVHCAAVEQLLGRNRQAQARLTAAHRMAADRPSPTAVRLKLELAGGCNYQNETAAMLDWTEQALAEAIGLGDRRLELTATGLLALARYFRGLPATDDLERAGAMLDGIDDATLGARHLGDALWIVWLEVMLERYDQAIVHCERAIDVSRATGQGAFVLGMMTALAWALVRTGRLDEAEETVTAAIEAGRLAPNAFLSTATGLSGVIATYRGDLDAAVRAGEESVRLARATDPGQIRAWSGLFLAIPLIELGEPRRARAAVLVTVGGTDMPLLARSGHTPAFEVLARAELGLGRLDAAEAWARRGEAATHGGTLAVESAFARRATAAVALARGDAHGAADIALAAAGRTASAGAPTEAGRCRVLAGRALIQAGRRHAAIDELEQAVEEFARSGAHGYRAEAEKELRRLGRRVARRPDDAPGDRRLHALSDREREIAELVSRGRTNREIAAVSYLSEKTIERHLTRIFAKLGVSSRSTVASLVAADGRDV